MNDLIGMMKEGLTRRDLFAMQAMTVMLAVAGTDPSVDLSVFRDRDNFTDTVFKLADSIDRKLGE